MTHKYSVSIHELWLVYCQLKDAQSDPVACAELIRSARERLGRAVNTLNRLLAEPKSPRQNGLTADTTCPNCVQEKLKTADLLQEKEENEANWQH
jgi:hypothetical protein